MIKINEPNKQDKQKIKAFLDLIIRVYGNNQEKALQIFSEAIGSTKKLDKIILKNIQLLLAQKENVTPVKSDAQRAKEAKEWYDSYGTWPYEIGA